MKKKKFQLQTLSFEVKYSFGNLFFDKLGQAINDIERKYPDWYLSNLSGDGCTIECHSLRAKVIFSNNKFIFQIDNAYNNKIEDIGSMINDQWKIIRSNFAVTDFIRTGVRYIYFIPTESTEEAEKIIGNSKLNISIPDQLNNSNFKVKNRHIVLVITAKDTEYRVSLAGITRSEAIDPKKLVHDDPRALPRNQQRARAEYMKFLSRYKADPMYAVQLDIDCVKFDPEQIRPEELVLKNKNFIFENFNNLAGEIL